MTEIRVDTLLDAPLDVVWADVSDIASHVEWMHDAESIDFTSAQRSGVGTTFRCATKIGPIRLDDEMAITAWQPPQTIGVRHDGIVTGEGAFELAAVGPERTRFTWTETLHFPWYLGGRIGERVGAPILKAVWKRNLALLRKRFGP